MKIVIDSDLCTGHGRCYALAPSLFDADDMGNGVVIVDTITDENRAAAETAIGNCPEQAISLVDG